MYHRSNGVDRDDVDGETDGSSASSHTSGLGPSPRHGSRAGDRTITAFEFEECVVVSHKSDHVFCLVDGELPLKEIAPDVVSYRQVEGSGEFECETTKRSTG